MLNRSLVKVARSFSTSAARRSGHGHGVPEPGDNLPFNIHNRYRLLFTFSVFFGSAAAFPFWYIKRAADKA